MRKIAEIRQGQAPFARAMVCPTPQGVYLFLYRYLEDGPSSADQWYESVQDALEEASGRFAIQTHEWKDIPDAEAGCLDDWIGQVRFREAPFDRDPAMPYERFVNGKWEPFGR